MRRFLAPVPKREEPGFAGTLRLLVTVLLLVAALLLWFSPLLLSTEARQPWSVRIVTVAGRIPIVLFGGLLLYFVAGALGAEHPCRPRRRLANVLMALGFLPWLLIVLIVTLTKEIGRDLSNRRGGSGTPTGSLPPTGESNASPSRETPSFGIG